MIGSPTGLQGHGGEACCNPADTAAAFTSRRMAFDRSSYPLPACVRHEAALSAGDAERANVLHPALLATARECCASLNRRTY